MSISSYVHVDAASSGGGDGSSWDSSGASAAYTWAEFASWAASSLSQGSVAFIKDGTYVMTADLNLTSYPGSATSPTIFIGVKLGTTNTGSNVVHSDWSINAADKPFIDGGTYRFTPGSYTTTRNIEFENSNNNTVYTGLFGKLINCKCGNDYGVDSATRYCARLNTSVQAIDCEFTSQHCSGTTIVERATVLMCYYHDFDYSGSDAIETVGNREWFAFNVFDKCEGVGLELKNQNTFIVLNNTFYDCGTGINATTAYQTSVINNIISTCTNGVAWTTQTDHNMFWKNCVYTNTTDFTNVDETTVFQDYELLEDDPEFASPGSDHSLQSTSPCLNNGYSIIKGVGSGGGRLAQGAWQNTLQSDFVGAFIGSKNIFQHMIVR